MDFYIDADFERLQEEVRELRRLVLCMCRMIGKAEWQGQVASDSLWRAVQESQDRQSQDR